MKKFDILKKLKLDGFWDNLSPSQKRTAVIVGAVSGLFLVVGLTSEENETAPATTARESVKRSVLTDADTRNIGIDSLNAKVKTVERENEELLAALQRMERDLSEMKKRRGNDPDVMRELDVLQNQVASLSGTAQALGWDVDDIKSGNVKLSFDQPPGAGNTDDNKTPEQKTQARLAKMKEQAEQEAAALREQRERMTQDRVDERPNDVNSYFQVAPIRSATQPPSGTGKTTETKKNSQPMPALQIVRIESKSLSQESNRKSEEIYLPAGSIVSGVLVNGIDAATGRGARNDPFPVLVRIQHEAILPNQFKADIAECFATLSGYGELSSERVMLRGEKFSCVTKDGSIIEENFPAYAVGNDAVAGLRGTLVSRAGSLIAKAGLAGFASGVAEAFGGNPVPVIQTGTVPGDRQYQSNITEDSLNYGVSRGASTAAERLADYYMDMADQMFSVITVDAGRPVDIVLTNGFSLKLKANKRVAENVKSAGAKS